MNLKFLYLIQLVFVVSILAKERNVRLLEDDDKHMHPDIRTDDARLNNPDELTAKYWRDNAQSYLKNKINQIKEINNNTAKNVIFFLGDGMSIHTTTATRVYLGGEEVLLTFDKFPYTGFSKTYCVNRQVADSACSATAYFSGVKANYGTIGVNAQVERYNCTKENRVEETNTESIIKWAQDAGKATGVITTSRITHATPAGAYAHTANRDWESDADVISDGCDPAETKDIARQLVESEVGRNLNVIFGCGKRAFVPKTVTDEDGKHGHRLDGRNLIDQWLRERNKQANASYIWNKSQLKMINVNETDHLMGLFGSAHCLFNVEVQKDKKLKELKPSLLDMVEVGIEMMQKSEKGYFLFVEGALIDTAHHDNWARKALDETAEFEKAIVRAQEMTKDTDTLIVVTSDHAHTMTINGYPDRGNDILGPSRKNSGDGKTFTTLSYANGPGYYNTYNDDGTRKDVYQLDYDDINLSFMSAVPISSATHGGEDVAVYADGPHAHLFTGNYEQNSIPLLMAYAAQIGPYGNSSASLIQISSMGLMLMVSLLLFIQR